LSAHAVTRRALLTPAREDAAVLRELLGVERAIVAAHRHIAAHAALRAPVLGALAHVAAHERVHVTVLARAAGAPASAASALRLDRAQRFLVNRGLDRSIARARSQHDALRVAIELEGIAEHAYYEAIKRLSSPAAIRLAAEIMAVEAQHETLLRRLQRHVSVAASVPAAFVSGRR
jgi:hypothetical protein